MYNKDTNDINGEHSDERRDGRFPEIMTRSELARYLRIDVASKSQNFDNVIINLQRMRNLPVVHICRQPLYWLPAVRDWLKQQVERGL